MRSPEELSERFRSAGLKLTPQRQAVFRVLHGNTTHPTAEAVHAAVRADLPMVSLRTVYQTLNDLAAMGEIGHFAVGTGSSRFDPNTAPHHHLVCGRCGRIEDFVIDGPLLPEQAATGFVVDREELIVRGTCAACVRSGDARPSTNPSTPPTTKEA